MEFHLKNIKESDLDQETQASLKDLTKHLGMSLKDCYEAWQFAGQLLSDRFGSDAPSGPISRWEVLGEILMNENLSRAQVIMASYIISQIATEIGIQAPILPGVKK